MHGMYLLVQPGGGRYWRSDYRHDGKRGTVAPGVYPDVSLKEARERRENARKLRLLIGFANPLIGTRPIGHISAPELLTVLRTLERGEGSNATRVAARGGATGL